MYTHFKLNIRVICKPKTVSVVVIKTFTADNNNKSILYINVVDNSSHI